MVAVTTDIRQLGLDYIKYVCVGINWLWLMCQLLSFVRWLPLSQHSPPSPLSVESPSHELFPLLRISEFWD